MKGHQFAVAAAVALGVIILIALILSKGHHGQQGAPGSDSVAIHQADSVAAFDSAAAAAESSSAPSGQHRHEGP